MAERRARAGVLARLSHFLDLYGVRSATRSWRISGGIARRLCRGKEHRLRTSLCARQYRMVSPRSSPNWRRGDIDLAFSSGGDPRLMTVTDIPVLFALSGDPVELGIVKSLAQPAANFTGTTCFSLELAGEAGRMLKDVFPTLRRLAVFSNTDHPGEQWSGARPETAQALGVEPVYIPFFGPRNSTALAATDRTSRCDARASTSSP